MRKLYVQVGRVKFRPTLRIRNTGFCPNQWQRLGRASFSDTNFHGAEPARFASVEEVVENYFEYLKRVGAKPIWVEE